MAEKTEAGGRRVLGSRRLAAANNNKQLQTIFVVLIWPLFLPFRFHASYEIDGYK
jgi:hypothetical protein